jgi:hypothetical protein
MIDYTQILIRKFDAQWTLNGDDYEGLVWLSDTPKPTKETLDKLWPEVQDLIESEAKAKAAEKAALLNRLGITQDETNLLFS